jgi:hypothetical protein
MVGDDKSRRLIGQSAARRDPQTDGATGRPAETCLDMVLKPPATPAGQRLYRRQRDHAKNHHEK